MRVYRSTGSDPYGDVMGSLLTDTTISSSTSGSTIHPATPPATDVVFDVTLRDGTVERVHGADAYEPERSMTTFFRTDGRPSVDCWSVRMASFRTEEILAVRRLETTLRAV